MRMVRGVRLYSEYFKDGEGVIGSGINIGILGYLLSLGDSSVLTASDQDHLSREIWDVLLRIESRARHLCVRESSRCVEGQCPVVEASCRKSKVMDEKYKDRSRITLYTERTRA